jgi:hypothetical protein
MIKRINRSNSRPLPLALSSVLLYLQVMTAAPLVTVADEQTCISNLDQAEESYYNGDLDKSINLVNQCLTDSLLSKEIRIRAYKLLARSYLSKEDVDLAKKTVLLLLEIVPTYQPTIEEESPHFVKLVTDTRAEQARIRAEQEKTGMSPWVWIGAGGAAAAAIIVLVATGSGGEENNNTNQPLPGPPALP